MKKFGIAGSPILHSLSPNLFKAAYHSDYSYLRLMVETPDEAMVLFEELGLSGINVTAPFKDVTLWGDGVLSREVEVLGAMNTIIKQDNKLYFHNTDVYGVRWKLPDVKGVKCLILGAGGAATAAAYTLIERGGDVIIANRTLSRAKNLANKLGCNYCGLDNIPHTKIIVNTLKVKAMNISKDQILIDAIYHDSPYSNSFANGMDWLVGQAIMSYKIFTKEDPDIEAMCQIDASRPTKLSFKGERSAEIETLFSKSLISDDGMEIWLYDGKSDYMNSAYAVIDAREKSKEKIYEEICKAL